jgi:HK97 family phage portal protein
MSLFGLFERRSILDNPAVPLTSASLLDVLGMGDPTDSGVRVNENTALRMAAVYRCVTLISGVAASLPLHVYKNDTLNRAASPLLDNPHPEMTAYELWKLTFVHRCLWGNAYLQKIRDSVGRVQELWPIPPNRVQVGRANPNDLNPSGKIFKVTDKNGEPQPMTTREILHIPGLGYDGISGVSPIRAASQAIGLSLAAEQYAAKLFGSGNLLSGILQTEQRLQQADAERLQTRWSKMVSGMDRAHGVAVLDSGATFQSVTMPNADAEMLASRKFQVNDISRFFGVPPFMLMDTEKSTSWGTGLEQQVQGWISFDLHPTWLAPTEQRITKELTTSAVYAKYSVEGLLRGDSVARAQWYRTMREIGVFNVDEIRELEDRPPVPNGLGKGYLQPLNFTPLGTAAAASTQALSEVPIPDDMSPGGGQDPVGQHLAQLIDQAQVAQKVHQAQLSQKVDAQTQPALPAAPKAPYKPKPRPNTSNNGRVGSGGRQ